MSPKILYILYTFNRPSILKLSLETLFNNNKTLPTDFLIIDDGSQEDIKNALYSFSLREKRFPIHFFSMGTNQGLGYNWELAWQFAATRKYDYIVQLEGDYIWRVGGLDEAIEVLEKKPLSCAVSGYSNPDFYNGRQHTQFSAVMIEDFGHDPAKREFLHKPFSLDTKFGPIGIQLTTNSCGCSIVNWTRVKQLLDKYPDMWEKVFQRSFNIPYPERRKYAGDGPYSGGQSLYWYKDIEDRIKNGEKIDYNTEGPWIDICDFSIANHINGGNSLCGYIVPEMQTFVSSPKWNDQFLTQNPRGHLF